jgi:hypothetical protein
MSLLSDDDADGRPKSCPILITTTGSTNNLLLFKSTDDLLLDLYTRYYVWYSTIPYLSNKIQEEPKEEDPKNNVTRHQSSVNQVMSESLFTSRHKIPLVEIVPGDHVENHFEAKTRKTQRKVSTTGLSPEQKQNMELKRLEALHRKRVLAEKKMQASTKNDNVCKPAASGTAPVM